MEWSAWIPKCSSPDRDAGGRIVAQRPIPNYLPPRLCTEQCTMLNLKVKPEKERVAFKHGGIEWMVDQQKPPTEKQM